MCKSCEQQVILPVTPVTPSRPEEKVIFIAVSPTCIRWGNDDLDESINDGWEIESVHSANGGDFVVFSYHLVKFPRSDNA